MQRGCDVTINREREGGGSLDINDVRVVVAILCFAKPNLTLFVLLFLCNDAGEAEASATACNMVLERRLLRRHGGGTIGKCF